MPVESDQVWSRVSEIIAEALGLHFAPNRWPDLERGLQAASGELGFESDRKCVDWLLRGHLTKEQARILASHLTIGETYFFRDRKLFDLLEETLLPQLIRARRSGELQLRLWSAGCCSGEEPYSLAILLHRLLPDLADWNIRILATDINTRFLQKAAVGVYGPWSFRDTPPGLKETYFRAAPGDRWEVAPEIRRLVTFAPLNLVQDPFPSLANDTNAMDMIFCRNVLMYFSPVQMRRVIAKFQNSLVHHGWLTVSPSEVSQALYTQFATKNFPGVILFRKDDAEVRAGKAPAPPVLEPPVETISAWSTPIAAELPAISLEEEATPEAPPDAPFSVAASLYEHGRYPEAEEAVLTESSGTPDQPRAFSLLARALANQGRLAEALGWCERWVAADKLDPAGHYLRAIVLLEQGEDSGAQQALQSAVYLDPEFVIAHFAMGNLARNRGRNAEAERHYGNVSRLLVRYQEHEILPESDGLAAGRLRETVTAMLSLETTP